MTRLLGGEASPIGWSVQYLEAPLTDVLAGIREVHGRTTRFAPPRPFPDVLLDLMPFEAPWTRELVLSCGGWTAYLNNGIDGGDPTAIGPALARSLDVRCVVACHAPPYGPGHGGTQLRIAGPDGTPPLMIQRTLDAVSVDGRWEWHTSGDPLPFEQTERYAARRIRDRFDRPLLLDYLRALGIPADHDVAYGDGVLVQQRVRWRRRTVTLDEARRVLAG